MKMAEETLLRSPEVRLDNNPENSVVRNQNFICGVVEGFYGRPWTTEQRKDLFAKMKKLGLNAYMYAPKDDLKHRAYWRELYTVEEAEHLTSLITAAKENGVSFYYALSPGLDVTYSNTKEISSLKRKLEQVAQFGCNAFALLFDDIEPDISETDKEVFQSFGHAQVSVTNEVYQHLSQPKFIFCPTEYCTTRAVPNVQNSEYLNIIGSKLLPGVDIMWTGSRVISQTISVQSIQELSEVLRRPPVIWDNLHANDYDQKRLFLGPYCGRSTELVPHMHGVMTNPNCEYETNYIAIHTLGQWSRCNADGKRDLTLNDSVTADIKLETESENGSVEDIPTHMSPNTYHPKRALQAAVRDWLPEFSKPKNPHGSISASPFIPVVTPSTCCPTSLVNTCMAITLTTTTAISNANLNQGLDDSSYHPATTELVNSLVTPIAPVPLQTKPDAVLEPMDCNPSPGTSPKHSDMPNSDLENGEATEGNSTSSDEATTSKSKDSDTAEDMQTEPIVSLVDESKQLTYEDVALLIDLFYLPFEHGSQALQVLQDFQWLKTNGHLVADHVLSKDMETPPEVQEWYKRAAKFNVITQAVGQMFTHLTYCQNRSLLYDLYPYVWDMKGVISLLNAYVKWIALGRVPAPPQGYLCPPYTWFAKGYKEAFSSGEQEPWLFRGGLTADLQRLLPIESVGDLFLYKSPDTPSNKVYTIRPYQVTDEEIVYQVCRKTCDDGLDGTDVFPDFPDLIGDKLVGGFLCLSPEYCFVVEDEDGVCGYALAALDALQFHQRVQIAWNPQLCSKYPSTSKDPTQMLTPAEELIAGLHNPKSVVPEVVYKHHPSILRLNMLPSVVDASIPKRLLTCVLSALKANGSHGVFCEVNVGDKNILDFYSKLGFLEIALPGFTCEDVLYLGRIF